MLNGINFWVNKGVLKGDRKGSDATWVVLETKEEGGRGGRELEMRNGQSPRRVFLAAFRLVSLISPFLTLRFAVVTEEESAIQSVESGQAEQMRVYWQVRSSLPLSRLSLSSSLVSLTDSHLSSSTPTSAQFIQGMLTNFGSMSLDRIQSMLGFAPDYNRSLEQLGEFMEALRREGVVDRAASGEWVLR